MKTPAFAAAVDRERAARRRRGPRRGLRRAPHDRDRGARGARGRARARTAPKPRDPLRAPLLGQLPEGPRDAGSGRRGLRARRARPVRGRDAHARALRPQPGRPHPGARARRRRRTSRSPARSCSTSPRAPSTCPSDPVQRAHVHAWMFFEQNQVEANIGVARFLALSGRAETDPWVFTDRQRRGRDALATLERGLGGPRLRARRALLGRRSRALRLRPRRRRRGRRARRASRRGGLGRARGGAPGLRGAARADARRTRATGPSRLRRPWPTT